MTTYKGIAAVTCTLGHLAGEAARGVLPDTRVTYERPAVAASPASDGTRLNVHLLAVWPSATQRPPRPAAGGAGPVQTSAPVDLLYLLSFLGTWREAQLMLGATELALRERPVLDAALVAAALAAEPELLDCGLEQQASPVQLLPTPLSLDELGRLWSGHVQAPAVLSTVWQARTVELGAT